MGNYVRVLVSAALIFAAAFTTSAARAQTREEIDRKPVSPLPRSVGQKVAVTDGIERAPCPLAAESFASVSLTLKGVEFGNLGAIPADILAEAYRDYVGKSIPVSVVCDIRDRAATVLRSRGYLAAVQVPPQRIEDGIVRFDVLVAKIVDFQVRGNAGKAESLIARYLSAIKNQPVFNIVEAERYLLLARDIPGYDVRLTLRPAGTVPGEVVGEVLVNYTRFEAEANIQNYGSRDTGRFGGLVQVHYNGLFGVGDRTSLGYFGTADFREQNVVQASQEVRVGREGLTLAYDFVYAWTKPTIDPSLDLRSETLVTSFEARYPLIRKQSRNLILAGGFDLINQRSRVNAVSFSRDKLRIGFLRATYDTIDPQSIASISGYSGAEPKWRFGGEIEIRQGLGVFGNSKDCGTGFARCAAPGVTPISRVEADTTAFVTRASFFGEYRPTPKFAIAFAGRGQYAPNALLGYEEFSAGNFTVGRGFNPGAISGDSGYGASIEARFGSLVPATSKSLAWQVYGFTDASRVWNEDTLSIPNSAQRLVSAGGGVRLAFGDRFNLDVGGAFPLRKAGAQLERADPRLLMNLTVKLAPWTTR